MTRENWRGFNEGVWQNEINVRDFIQKNYTEYKGDAEFLSDATPRTKSLMKKVEALLKEYPTASLTVAGGVAANSHLRHKLSSLCDKMGRTLCMPPVSLCGDNAAMIAAQGYYEYLCGHIAESTQTASAEDDAL